MREKEKDEAMSPPGDRVAEIVVPAGRTASAQAQLGKLGYEKRAACLV